MLWRITDIGKVMMRSWITKPSAWLLVWSSWASLAGLLGFGLAEISTPPKMYEPPMIANGNAFSSSAIRSWSTVRKYVTSNKGKNISIEAWTSEK